MNCDGRKSGGWSRGFYTCIKFRVLIITEFLEAVLGSRNKLIFDNNYNKRRALELQCALSERSGRVSELGKRNGPVNILILYYSRIKSLFTPFGFIGPLSVILKGTTFTYFPHIAEYLEPSQTLFNSLTSSSVDPLIFSRIASNISHSLLLILIHSLSALDSESQLEIYSSFSLAHQLSSLPIEHSPLRLHPLPIPLCGFVTDSCTSLEFLCFKEYNSRLYLIGYISQFLN